MPEVTRVFFGVDAHGSERVWRKFLSVPKMYNTDILILAGDLTGKMIVPIVKQNDGTYRCHAFGQKWTATNEAELEGIKEKILFSGYYPYVSNPEEVQELKSDEKKVGKLFEQEMLNNIERWVKMVDEKVSTEVKVVVMPGNDDSFVIDEPIKKSGRVIYPLGKTVNLCFDYQMISMDYSNPTPWESPRECSEDELWKRLEDLKKLIAVDWNRVICNFHCPPFGTQLDLAPKLGKNLTVRMTPGGVEKTNVGSKSVRKFIETYQPFMGLHGHIHESTGFENLGRTICFNPGSEYGEGVLKGVILEISDKGLEKWTPISG